MLGGLIGTTATSLVARQIGSIAAGPAGAVLGLALPFVAKRLGPAGMVAMAVGVWAMTRILDGEAKKTAADPADPV
jgi:sorbitol-specific phosphotransferase system component IIBC